MKTMKKPSKVIILPTKDDLQPPFITIRQDRYGDLFDFPSYQEDEIDGRDNPQHLYITSDEEVKKGDWYIENTGLGVLQQVYFMSKENYDGWHKDIVGKDNLKRRCKKIIATTDKSLKIPNGKPYESQDLVKVIVRPTKSLPQIHQQFIEEYGKAGGIDEVLLEYEHGNKRPDLSHGFDDGKSYQFDWILKTDQNNCVITHHVEPKLYTREEVSSLIAKYWQDEVSKQGTYKGFSNWIKENL